ncbi:MAG: peptidase M16 [Desulfobulbaceae bacterium]|nr:peptidase M16 [Desulfobulbaceae bacterium]
MTFTEGSTYSGFSLKVYKNIKEIDSEVYLFEHETLKCPLLAIKNGDSNKTFSAAFNTIPTDSTGVAHILEHSVLMGSEKYPVKDVFGEINKGGLTTFLNAMTGGDITYYPFATRNLKEYFNIMDVYCDVVFNPLLAPSTFEQEGWHYHQEGEDNSLEFQGVVYNEMKGAFSDPIRFLFHHIFAGLMPGSTYAHESGGDPKNIPDLSYKQFCEFHKNHYHPSNGMFFVYGDAPLEEELDFLQSRFFTKYNEAGHRSAIEEGTLATEPVFINDTYAVDSDDLKEKTFLAVGTNISTVVKREENTAFQIIANILFNSDGSPLKNSIVSSGLCKDFGGLYLATSSYRTLMLTYLVGSEPEHRDTFLALYKDSLAKMVEEGLDHDLVLSELNKFEFSFREEASKAQRGLDLIGKSMVGLKYQTDPLEYLSSEELVQSLRHKALNEGYFEELIKDYLLDNQATVTVTLTPDPEKQKQSQEEEQQRLASYNNSSSAEEKQRRRERTKELMEQQQVPNSAETLALLPQLSLSDLSTQIDFHKVTPTTMFGKELLVSELPTNHISYLDVGFNISCLPPEQLPLLDLFGTILTEIGTKRLNYQQFAKEIATCTGSFSHSITTYSHNGDTTSTKPVLWLHLKCLPDYLEQALELLAEIFSSVSFADKGRIREIVGREFAWAEHAVQSEGYSLPATRVFAHLSKAGKYNELVSGVTSYLAVKDLVLNYQEKEAQFLATLEAIGTQLFNSNNLILSATADQSELEKFTTQGRVIIDSLTSKDSPSFDLPELDYKDHEAYITAAEVVFAVQGGNLLKNGKGYNGSFEVLKTYLSRDYLWNTVRQMGGAYGCFIQFGQLSGNLTFVSYRDPQVKKTYDAYNQVPGVVASLDLSEQVMDQLIIGTYGNFDPLHSAAAKGATARNDYLNGITPEFKQQRLQEIIATTPDDLRSFAPAFEAMMPNCFRSIIGNRKKIEKDAALFDSLTEL